MADPAAPSKGRRRLWKVAFVLSLAFNFAIVGFVAGAALSGRAFNGPPRSFDLSMAPMLRALEAPERRQIIRTLRQERAWRNLNPRARTERMITVLSAEPFDPDAFEALIAEQGQSTSDLQAKLQQTYLDMVIGMSPERRQAFAARLQEELTRPRRGNDAPSGG